MWSEVQMSIIYISFGHKTEVSGEEVRNKETNQARQRRERKGSYLQYLDVLWGNKQGDSNTDEGQANYHEARDDNTSREHRLPCRKPLLSKGCIVWSVQRLCLLLHYGAGDKKTWLLSMTLWIQSTACDFIRKITVEIWNGWDYKPKLTHETRPLQSP